jgi:uncharacterized protein (TIGR02246 family)
MMGLFDRYAQAWASRDPDAIVALHTEQSVFHLRLDRAAVTGRTALRAAFAELLAQWPKLGVEPNEVRYGTDFWVLNWTLTAELREAGASRRVRVDCLDLAPPAPKAWSHGRTPSSTSSRHNGHCSRCRTRRDR